MLDITAFNIRTFELKLKENTVIHINPPKIKALKSIIRAAKSNDIDVLTTAIATILNNNKENRKFEQAWVDDNLSIDESKIILRDYFDWINGIKENPN